MIKHASKSTAYEPAYNYSNPYVCLGFHVTRIHQRSASVSRNMIYFRPQCAEPNGRILLIISSIVMLWLNGSVESSLASLLVACCQYGVMALLAKIYTTFICFIGSRLPTTYNVFLHLTA